VAAVNVVGVPEMAPVELLRLIPAGKVGDTLNVAEVPE